MMAAFPKAGIECEALRTPEGTPIWVRTRIGQRPIVESRGGLIGAS